MQCLKSLQLANEANVEVCVPQPVSAAVGQLVQFQQRAARLAADGCDAGKGTDMAEKENVKEKGLDPDGHRCRRCFLGRNAL